MQSLVAKGSREFDSSFEILSTPHFVDRSLLIGLDDISIRNSEHFKLFGEDNIIPKRHRNVSSSTSPNIRFPIIIPSPKIISPTPVSCSPNFPNRKSNESYKITLSPKYNSPKLAIDHKCVDSQLEFISEVQQQAPANLIKKSHNSPGIIPGAENASNNSDTKKTSPASEKLNSLSSNSSMNLSSSKKSRSSKKIRDFNSILLPTKSSCDTNNKYKTNSKSIGISINTLKKYNSSKNIINNKITKTKSLNNYTNNFNSTSSSSLDNGDLSNDVSKKITDVMSEPSQSIAINTSLQLIDNTITNIRDISLNSLNCQLLVMRIQRLKSACKVRKDRLDELRLQVSNLLLKTSIDNIPDIPKDLSEMGTDSIASHKIPTSNESNTINNPQNIIKTAPSNQNSSTRLPCSLPISKTPTHQIEKDSKFEKRPSSSSSAASVITSNLSGIPGVNSNSSKHTSISSISTAPATEPTKHTKLDLIRYKRFRLESINDEIQIISNRYLKNLSELFSAEAELSLIKKKNLYT
ncbi:hypothetical protein AYI70_g5209 [Smittium culicis]|uniref:Uncharacterized protein n=1 Tax=Smittium culicis TaxID=133412 RepID=A0A1R1XVK3_9FUNG|nr:hypothetical protein AYI70_g5209 [Smittium culicis]